ncbi:MAG: zinc-ribbon domain-containing protein [Ruminococcaceae bacterium]|nr:zinc-ribbon domain-containing protein [Oscillospiraceae bacterium]
MICTKCNSIVPDEAKFCPSCGADCKPAPAAQNTSEKKQCVKCGLELENNAKFCPVCGTAVNAVSLDKQPDSDSLVSAMPGSVPTPTAVAAPSMGTAPYTPSADATPSGFGEPAPMPQYAPPAGGFGEPAPMPQYAPPTGGFGDMGNMGAVSSAAAATAAPVKKKNGAKIAIIVIAATLVALLAAAAIFFFTNRAAFLSTFMGKSRYAAMVEGNSVKEAAQKIDASAISNGIKSASQLYTSSAGSSLGDIMPMSYNTSGVSLPSVSATDFSALIETYSKVLTETYGVDAIKITGGANINLTDSAISAIGNASDVKEIIDIINGTTFTYDLAANDSMVGAYVGAEGKITVNAKVLVNEDGTCYLALPFASDKALMFKVDSDSYNTPSASETVALELDEKEISRLIEELIKIYLKHYEKAVTEMENGSLTINGEPISGKLITADFNGEILSDMMSDMINHIGEDKYLSTQIVDFVNKNGGEITLSEYQAAFSIVANTVSLPDSVGFSIKTVINKNGDILAKSYTAGPNNEIEFTYKNSEKSFNAQLIFNADGEKFTAKVDCVKIDDKSGTVELSFQENDDGEYKFTIAYSGVETVKSFNRDVTVGTFTVTVNMPKGFNAIDDELLTVLDGLQVTVSSSATADSQTVDLSVKTPVYGNAAITLTVSKSSSNEILAVPSNVIDFNGDMDSNTEKKFEEFEQEVEDALKNIDVFKGIIGEIEPSVPVTPVTPNPPSIFTPGASHANDDFSSMSFDELDELFDEYIDRRYDVSAYSGDSEFYSKLVDVNETYLTAHNYWFDYCYEYDYNDEATLNEFRNSLRDFVIAVEACEALID